jgi:hypothetical protein
MIDGWVGFSTLPVVINLVLIDAVFNNRSRANRYRRSGWVAIAVICATTERMSCKTKRTSG